MQKINSLETVVTNDSWAAVFFAHVTVAAGVHLMDLSIEMSGAQNTATF